MEKSDISIILKSAILGLETSVTALEDARNYSYNRKNNLFSKTIFK